MDETSRLACLASYSILDTPAVPQFDRFTALAASLFDAPFAFVSLIDATRQWFKSHHGLDATSTPREHSFCQHVLPLGPKGLLVVEDAARDARFSDNPSVTGAPGVRFYAGAALSAPDGHVLGTLCVADTSARARPSERQLDQLRLLASAVVDALAFHKLAEQDRERRHLLELAERMSGVGHWRLDLASGHVEWSAELYAIHGLSQDAFTPTLDTGVSLFHPDDQETLKGIIKEVRRTGKDFAYQLRLIRSDGAVRQVACRARCQSDELGCPHAIFGVFQDVTDSVELIKQAEAAAVAKGEFLANMSHELRTPLTSIIGFAKLMPLDPSLSDKSRRMVGKIDTASQHLLTVVNDILDFTKLEAGQVTISLQPIDIADLCSQAIELITPQADNKGIALRLKIAAPPYPIALDHDRVQQVLINLLSNAVKFTEKGEVTLNVHYDARERRLRCAVIDTGAGISDANQSHLFQRFYQVDGATTKAYGGTGLGLAISKGFIEAMGGDIGVVSKLGQGSQFWFSIPALSADLTSAAA